MTNYKPLRYIEQTQHQTPKYENPDDIYLDPKVQYEPDYNHNKLEYHDSLTPELIKKRRLNHLLRQKAYKGANCPPEILMEIEDLEKELGL